MTIKLSPKLQLLLWRLLITGEQPAISRVKPKLKPAERESLIAHGLITLEKRQRSKHLVLTDKTWDWAASNMARTDPDIHFPPNSNAATVVLETLLLKLGTFLRTQPKALVDLLAPEVISKDDNLIKNSSEIRQRIYKAYMQTRDGATGLPVRLSELRKRIADIPRAELDQVLLGMQKNDEISLLAADDMRGIIDEERACAIDLGGDRLRFYLYISPAQLANYAQS